MTFQRILVPLAGAAFLYFAWHSYGLPGLGMAGGGIVMWVLLHFTRLMHILKKASERPVGYVGSAVMLNVKLKKGWPLMKVIALTRSLGEQLSEADQQPEVYRWRDGGDSHVTCEFTQGRLTQWTLWRPDPEATGDTPAAD